MQYEMDPSGKVSSERLASKRQLALEEISAALDDEHIEQAAAGMLELDLIKKSDPVPPPAELEQIVATALLKENQHARSKDEKEARKKDPKTAQDGDVLKSASFETIRYRDAILAEPFLSFVAQMFGEEAGREFFSVIIENSKSSTELNFASLNGKTLSYPYQDRNICGYRALIIDADRGDPLAVLVDLSKKIKACKESLDSLAPRDNAHVILSLINLYTGETRGTFIAPLVFSKIEDPNEMTGETLFLGSETRWKICGDVVASALEAEMKKTSFQQEGFLLPSELLTKFAEIAGGKRKAERRISKADADYFLKRGEVPLGVLRGGDHFVDALRSLNPERELAVLVDSDSVDVLLKIAAQQGPLLAPPWKLTTDDILNNCQPFKETKKSK